jgi:hypothetical protein
MRKGLSAGLLTACLLAPLPVAAVDFEAGFDGQIVNLELVGLIGPMDIERSVRPDGPWSLIESRPIGCTDYCYYQDEEARPGSVFYYRIWVPHDDGTKDLYGPLRVEIPDLESLGFASLAAPNPFSSHTTLHFHLPSLGSSSETVRIDFIDAAGRRLRTYEQAAKPGSHVVPWDGRSESGEALPSGIYFYRVAVPGYTESGRILMVK